MRIVVNDIAASEGGALSVLLDFYRAVCEYDKENEYIFLLSDNYIQETERIQVLLRPDVKKSGFKKVWFDFVSGRFFVNRLKPDVVLSLQNIITFGVRAPQAVYIHQSIPFQKERKFSVLKKEERKLALIQYGIGRIICRSANKADTVIVQTAWMRDALLEKVKTNREKVRVVTPDVRMPEDQTEIDSWSLHRFFYPTADFQYKNNEVVLEAVGKLAEEAPSDFCVELTLEKTAPPIKGIRFIGRLFREELWQKYRSATLIYASYIETFGLPLAEARKCGTVILAADCAYAREVLEGYENAYFFDYHSSEALAALMRRVLRGDILRKESISDSQEETENSWCKIVDILQEIKHVLHSIDTDDRI